MKKRLIITESDRQNILSMYGVLTEGVLSSVTIRGRLLNNQTQKSPESDAKIILFDSKDNIKGRTVSNQNGEFSFNNIETIDTGKIKLNITTIDGNNANSEFTLSNTDTNLGDIYISDIIKVKELPGGGAVKVTTTNIKISLETDKEESFILTMSPKDDETILFKKIINKNTPIDLTLLKSGQNLNELPNKFKVDKINDFFDSKGEPNLMKYVTIKLFDKKNKLIYQDDFVVKIPNSSIKVNKTTNEQDEVFYDKNESELKIIQDKENNINLILASLALNVTDENNQPLNDVTIIDKNTNQEYKTNQNGNVVIGNVQINDVFNFELKKENFRNSLFNVSKLNYGVNTFNVKLTPKIGYSEISGDPEDNYKDTLFTIFGRGKTKNTFNECVIIAKNDILNKFIEKHKSKYGNLSLFKKQDIDLKYEMVYKRPSEIVKKMQGENSVIIKSKKSDVRLAISSYIKENNIEVSSEPFEYDNLTLDEAINRAYSDNKTVFVVVGTTTNDETKDMNNLLQEEFSDEINEKFVPVFVNVDSNNENYKKLRSYIKFDSYPRIIYLRRDDKGKVDVIKNLNYYEFKNDINKL